MNLNSYYQNQIYLNISTNKILKCKSLNYIELQSLSLYSVSLYSFPAKISPQFEKKMTDVYTVQPHTHIPLLI